MFSLIKAFQRMDPASKNAWEIIFLYPGTKAIFFHRLAHACFKMKIPFLPRMISELSRFFTGIDIHPGATIGSEVVIDHGIGVVIGETAVIGNRVLIYQGVTLGSTKNIQGKRHPTIQDDVILGAGSKILGNIEVGQGSRVGANSVVFINVPPNSAAVGIPAKIISKEVASLQSWNLEYQI